MAHEKTVVARYIVALHDNDMREVDFSLTTRNHCITRLQRGTAGNQRLPSLARASTVRATIVLLNFNVGGKKVVL